MQTSQLGLKDCFKRASEAIYTATYKSVLAGINNPSAMDMANADMAAKAAVENAVLSQSFLRLEQPVVAGLNTIKFPILANQNLINGQRASEIRLELQDAFFMSNLVMYITKAASTTSVAFPLLTYPNAVDFPLGGLITTGEAPLYTLYNGFLKVTINKSVIIPNYPLSNFLQVPQSQKVSATANAQITQFDPNVVALTEPNVNFIGSKANNLEINMPAGILTANLDANTYVIFILQGVLAQNVTILS